MGAPEPGRPARDYTLQPRGQCRSCGAAIWWRSTANGKQQPMNLDASGEPTDVSHFADCPQRDAWRRKDKR